jgi:predicted RNA-binding Zn-ribbon protein involved in translation (DUF1610 family)
VNRRALDDVLVAVRLQMPVRSPEDKAGVIGEGDAMSDETRFSARCPECGEMELAAEQMWLVITDPPERTHFDFHCPSCEQHVAHPADRGLVAILGALLPVEVLEIPAEALEERSGPALSVDDLIDLMLGLDALDVRVAEAAPAA